MKILICSGGLYSNWQKVLEATVLKTPSNHSITEKLSTLGQEICRSQFSEMGELEWRAFDPSDEVGTNISEALPDTHRDTLITWCDNSISLYLNFWKEKLVDARFLLLYSSPELELSNYIGKHGFEPVKIEKVMEAWVARTTAMLDFLMNNRDRCLLVNVQDVVPMSQTLSALIHGSFGFELSPGGDRSSSSDLNKQSSLTGYLATTLLLRKHHVSELYDEVRSAASMISDQDRAMPGIEYRSQSLINSFLSEVSLHEQLSGQLNELEGSFSLQQKQIMIMLKELEQHTTNSNEQSLAMCAMNEYLAQDRLLKLTRHVRKLQ